jgi:hypothetical protein
VRDFTVPTFVLLESYNIFKRERAWQNLLLLNAMMLCTSSRRLSSLRLDPRLGRNLFSVAYEIVFVASASEMGLAALRLRIESLVGGRHALLCSDSLDVLLERVLIPS